ncbi:uncharacterized protein YndB with AHSA1/START domain [Caulobacter ginsengisoli]|uniref:Uncharacterized protein YndB with AHSA1/START domain n=1 Tax=Caulobacter ginsengisoli TaxID=400775 RepID=A0ABU0IUI2_9CAUL|nr:SRPBCC family protein [Caulobacter ginsengisoli]MDQ0465678.1 uncharacterized protein YndB with AHSA1/START domain [Caulobacter ginsengisoli]
MRAIVFVTALLLAGPAAAEVVDSQPNGFEVRQSAAIKAPAAKVYADLVKIGAWWGSDHSWSGDARNITIDARPGGCWCETWAGGGVLHMTVIDAQPGKQLRFAGALGPLSFSGLDGHMAWTLGEKDGVTTVTWTYAVGGYVRGGLGQWPAGVDKVLTEQLERFKRFEETGKPD